MAEVAIFTPRKRKLTSIVWNYYDRIKNDDGTCVARCKHCKKQLNGASRSGTTHLRKHLESCLPLQLKKSRQRKLTSPVWNEYDRIKNGDGSCVARCKHCNRQLTGASKSGTTHLRKHLDACPCYKGLKESFQDVGPLLLESGDLSKDGTSSLQDFKFDQDVSRLDLARMIILHEYPFSIVHHVGFKTFVKNLQPSFKMMSRNTIKADCMKIIEKERKKLYEILDKLPSRVSLTADLWSSDQNSGYLCLTGHYIDDDWKLQKRILNFCMLEEPLVGESIAKTIMEKLFEWNIDRKLLSIVLDNSTTNDEVVQELVKILAPKGSLFMSCDVFHVRCFANILNLMAQDGMEVIDDVINKVRESIKFVKSTDPRQQRFKDVAAQVGVLEKCLVLDVSTRWNSTYLMLESALDFKDAFFCLAELDSEYTHVPSFEEWDNVKTVHSRLKSFYDVMQVLSCARYPTANIYFAEVCCIYLLLKEWRLSTQPSIASMASKMMQKFEKYWHITNLVLAIAAILDPRLKMKPIEFYFPLIYGSNDVQQKIADVRVSLTNLYNEYVARSALTSINRGLPWNVESNCSSPSNECGVSGASEVSSCSTRIDRRRGLDKFLQETSSTQQIKSDLEMYLEEAVYPVQNGLDENFDILAWWKFCGPKYPIVAQMARDILGIPVSTVVSEVAFSTGSRVLDQYRSSMHPSTVQSLVCAQDWLRNEIQESINGSLDGLSLSTVTTAVDPDGEVDLCMTMSTDDEF